MTFRPVLSALARSRVRRLGVVFVLAFTGACGGALRAEGPATGPTQPAATDRVAGTAGTSPYGDFLAARHAERSFNNDLAAELYARTLAQTPDNPALMRETMHQMLAAGRIEAAAEIAGRYLEHEPGSVIAGLALAVMELARHRPEAAEDRLAAIPARGLGSYFVPLTLSWTKFARGDVETALVALAPLGKLRGGAPFHDYHAALMLDLAGDTARAADHYDRLSANGFSGYARFVELAGAFHERRGDVAKARDIYIGFLSRRSNAVMVEAALARLEAGRPPPKEIASAAHGAAEALFNLATLLNQENVAEIGMIVLQMAIKLRPDFDEARLLRGDILAAAERDEAAIAAYDKVEPKSPLGWSARLRAAQLLDRIGKSEVAYARLRDMGREAPRRSDAMVVLGDLLRFKKRYGEAVDAYDTALARIGTPEEQHWSLLYSRGIALERARQWDRAEADFLRALDFEPEQPFVLNYLGYSWVEKGRNLERALGMLEKAVRLRPNDGYIIDSLGWAHYQLKAFESAVTYLERAVELSSQDPTVNDHLGDAYWRVGRHYEARFQWERALSLEPEPTEVPAIEKKLADGLPETAAKREAGGAERARGGG
jgi:tetratricopeptide (TPR) repeat protein